MSLPVPVDALSGNINGCGGGKGGVDSNNSYGPWAIRTGSGDSITFTFSGNGGNTLFWNWPDTLPTGS